MAARVSVPSNTGFFKKANQPDQWRTFIDSVLTGEAGAGSVEVMGISPTWIDPQAFRLFLHVLNDHEKSHKPKNVRVWLLSCFRFSSVCCLVLRFRVSGAEWVALRRGILRYA